jgi:hypothetical protein
MLLMSKRRKILTWLGLVLSLPAASYAGVSVIYYAWLNAAEPERWPSERAGLWSGAAAVLALLFLASFVYCLASLIGEANRMCREEQKQHGQ